MTTILNLDAINAIGMSSMTDSIVHIADYDGADYELRCEADGSADADTETEYWGSDRITGATWRVHLHRDHDA